MWTPEDRVLVGDFGSGQALSDDQYRLIEPHRRNPAVGLGPPICGGCWTACSMSCALDVSGAICHRLQLFRRGRQSMAISELSWRLGCGRPSAILWS